MTKICAKANSVLGFNARTLRNTLSPSTLYISLVRPIRSNGSTVWELHQAGHYYHYNLVQRRFLQLLGVSIPMWFCRTFLTSIRSSRFHSEEQPLTLFSSSRLSMALWTGLNFYIRLTSSFLLELILNSHSHKCAIYHSNVPHLLRLRNAAQLDLFGVTLQCFQRQGSA